MEIRTVEAIDVVTTAKGLGVMGLIWGVIIGITLLIAGILGAGTPGFPELVVTVIGGPVYGIVVGAMTAIIYNAAASLVGGLELELT